MPRLKDKVAIVAGAGSIRANGVLDQVKAALAVYDKLNIPWNNAPASHRAVYAAALGLNAVSAASAARP